MTQGKLKIPKDLCEKAGMAWEAEIVRMGRWEYFEVLSKENFETGTLDLDGLGVF